MNVFPLSFSLSNVICVVFRLLAPKNSGYLINTLKSKPADVFKRHISDVKGAADKSRQSNIFLVCSPWKLCTGISLGLAARVLLSNREALCKAAQNSRIIQRRPNIQDDSAKFDWKKLFEYLWPHRWLLAAAVAVSGIYYYYFYPKHFLITILAAVLH